MPLNPGEPARPRQFASRDAAGSRHEIEQGSCGSVAFHRISLLRCGGRRYRSWGLWLTKFHPDLEPIFGDTCPPRSAQPVNQPVYRGIKQSVITANDFVSHAEGKLNGYNINDCDHWGLSVWTTMAAVEHARKTYKAMRRWHIAKGAVTVDDGVLLATPSGPQPEHYTFWKYLDRDLTASFQIVLNPANSS